MSNTYNDDAIEDCIWSVIESSQNAADHITYLQHLLSSPRHRDKAIDRAVSLFSPALSSVQGSYYSAFEAIERLAKSEGDPETIKSAWFNYAKMLHNGYGVTADRKKAATAYEWAISLGEIRSLINLGALYEQGRGGINQDLQKARDLFQQAIDRQEPLGYLRMAETYPEDAFDERRNLLIKGAESGCMYAAIRIGKLFNGGQEGFEKDPAQGMYWIERSAAAGNGYAAFYMGWHYENGHSVGQDAQLALKWYETGVALGDRASMAGLAALLYTGADGVEENYQKSMHYMLRAAVLGELRAQRRYGRELLWGALNPGADEDLRKKGVAWLTLSEQNGDEVAAEILGRIYRRGIGVEVDHEKSSAYLLKAARAGIPEAQGQIGLNYWYGVGLEVDHVEAYKWLSICALQAQAEGIYFLGKATELGVGCESNPQEAVKLYRRAAEMGESEAIFALGACAYTGRGMECDPRLAVSCFQRAANKGHTDSMVRLGIMLHDGEHVLTNYEEAARWFLEAAQNGDPRGMYLLGRMYEDGDGVAESADEARRWISKSAMSNYPPAKEWIEKNLPKSPKWLTQLVNPSE